MTDQEDQVEEWWYTFCRKGYSPMFVETPELLSQSLPCCCGDIWISRQRDSSAFTLALLRGEHENKDSLSACLRELILLRCLPGRHDQSAIQTCQSSHLRFICNTEDLPDLDWDFIIVGGIHADDNCQAERLRHAFILYCVSNDRHFTHAVDIRLIHIAKAIMLLKACK